AVSKLIGRLEDRLGARLLNRTTRRVVLTPAGELYLGRCRQILKEIDEVETEIRARGNEPRGTLRINTGVAFATHQLMPVMPEFLLRYPKIEPDISVNDRIIDLLAANADVAIRIGRVVDTSLMMRKVCDLHRVICASPDYLRRHGTPLRPGDLHRHECLALLESPGLSHWPFRIDGTVQTISVKSRIRIDNAEALLRLGIAGAGIIRVGDNLAGAPIRAGRLVPLLTDSHHDEAVPVSAVYPIGRQRSPAVRAFVDFIVEKFADAPWHIDDGADGAAN
ncbi:MAG: LysR family transcriptional regulator, partial [Hyphomicrobiales bacterium]|nr:LysR family transcriptional regulator [Hyphomicrobiales bacterium]